MKKYFILFVILLLSITYYNPELNAKGTVPNNIVLNKNGSKYYSYDKGRTWTKHEESKSNSLPQRIRLQKTNGEMLMSYDAGITWFKVLDNTTTKDISLSSSIENLDFENGDYLLSVYNLFGLKLIEVKVNDLLGNPSELLKGNFLLPSGLYIIQIKGIDKNIILKTVFIN